MYRPRPAPGRVRPGDELDPPVRSRPPDPMRWAALGLAVCTACGAPARKAVGPPVIPMRSGSLVIDVVYPPLNSLISARDSNFIFGSVGNGRARLSINGQAVSVEANGAFLAWLPVAVLDDTLARYELVAELDGSSVRSLHTVRLPAPTVPAPADVATIEVASLAPRGAYWVRSGERVAVRARATPGARVKLHLPNGESLPLTEAESGVRASAANWIFGAIPTDVPPGGAPGSGVYEAELFARLPVGRGARAPELPPVTPLSGVEPFCAPPDTARAEWPLANVEGEDMSAAPLEGDAGSVGGNGGQAAEACALVAAVVGSDTVRSPLPLDLWILREPFPTIELREEPASFGQDGFIQGRSAPGSTTRWLWVDGVRARVTGRRGGSVRLALDQLTEAWVSLDEVVWLRGTALAPRARVSTVRVQPHAGHLGVRLAMSHVVPYDIEVDGSRLTLILYGAYSDTDWLRYGPEDPYLRSIRWEQPTHDRYLLHLDLAAAPWGYRVRARPGALELDVRKPPSDIDPRRPLAGRLIAVDPGHPPAGATGPTRLYEGDANLAVGLRLKRLLEAEGAEVVMTRTDRRPVRLYDRTASAELLDAEILVSIHNNALPDGVNPYQNHGTSVYYFHPYSLDLARALQRNLLQTLGLHDLGIGRASLALARPTWMPAALTEGAFMMIPRQEAGLRDSRFLEAYARGVLAGLREFLAPGGQ